MIKHIVSALVLTSLGGVAFAGNVAEGNQAQATLAMVGPTRIEQPVALTTIRQDNGQGEAAVEKALDRKVQIMTQQLSSKLEQRLEAKLKNPM